MTLSFERTTYLHSSIQREKRIHEMNCLADIAWLPTSVFAVAALDNVLAVLMAYWVHQNRWESYYMLLCFACLIMITVLPVFLVRLIKLRAVIECPPISQMKLFADFYKLSDWVYLLSAANAGFWVMISWTLFTYRNTLSNVFFLIVLSCFCTLLPLLIRLLISVWNGIKFAPK